MKTKSIIVSALLLAAGTLAAQTGAAAVPGAAAPGTEMATEITTGAMIFSGLLIFVLRRKFANPSSGTPTKPQD